MHSVRDQAPARGRPRSERSRRAILNAAAKLLTERGYADITIEGVAAEAGVGKTTIYRWWSTKADIYVDLYSELALKIVPPPDTGDYRRDLVILVQGAYKLYRRTAAGLALAGIVAEAQSNAVVSKMVRTEFAPSRRQVIMTILQHGVRRGEIAPDVDLDIVCELIAAAVWFSLLVGNRPLTSRRAEQLVNAIIAGVPRGSSASTSIRADRARSRIAPRGDAAAA
jgi:AcrR family transcriptional regulator